MLTGGLPLRRQRHAPAMKPASTRALLALMGTALSVASFAAPPAIAGEAPAPVTGWTSGTVTCPGGVKSVFPVIIANATSVAQTGSITFPAALSAVQWATSQSAIDCNLNPGGSVILPQFDSVNITVQPGQTAVYWMAIGSTANQGSGSSNIALGGLPSGTSGQSWYDFAVSLNGANTFTNGSTFSSMQLQYDGTGGLDNATNGQNLFNIVQCTSGTNSVAPSNDLLTPYNAGWIAGPTYGINQPICAGWYPQGQFQQFSSVGGTGFTLQAVQSYNGGVDLAFAGTSTATITGGYIVWSGPFASIGPGGPTLTATVPLSSAPGASSGWWVQDPATLQWAVVGATPPANMLAGQYASASLFLNGLPVGTS